MEEEHKEREKGKGKQFFPRNPQLNSFWVLLARAMSMSHDHA